MWEKAARARCVEYVLGLLLGDDFPSRALGRKVVYCEREADVPADAVLGVVSSGFFGEKYGKPESLPSLPLKEIEGVPLLYGTPDIRREGGRLVVYADIIASAYFLVTRYEEVVRRDVRDAHGRFPGKMSLPYRAGFLDRPIVDEYAALLRRWLKEVAVSVPEPRRRFSVLLTHDVDTLRKYPGGPVGPVRVAYDALVRRKPLQNVGEGLRVCLRLKRDPYDTFAEMRDLDAMAAHVGAPQPVYFVMALRPGQGAYAIEGRLARRTLEAIRRSGAAIGLHVSYEAGKDPQRIEEEKARLEQACAMPVRRSRHHYLAWREVEHGWQLARAGIDWDSTLGYADVAGFRLGVCRPIPLFDPVRLESFGIEEHPLTIMDCSLDWPHYMGLDEDGAFEYCKHLMDHARRHGGELVMLWHNTSFAPGPGNYYLRLYQRLMAEAVNEMRP